MLLPLRRLTVESWQFSFRALGRLAVFFSSPFFATSLSAEYNIQGREFCMYITSFGFIAMMTSVHNVHCTYFVVVTSLAFACRILAVFFLIPWLFCHFLFHSIFSHILVCKIQCRKLCITSIYFIWLHSNSSMRYLVTLKQV